MTLYLIGLGIDNEKDITLKGLEAIKKCGKVYLENYTSLLNCPVSKLENLYGKKIILADRNMIENQAEDILELAKKQDIALLVIGDPFSATTHTDLVLRSKQMKVKTEVIHNTSILNAVGEVGLELYKYGKTTSVPFPAKGFEPETPYDAIKDNQKIGLHTLVLLDLRPDEERFMSAAEGVKNLLDIEKRRGEGVFNEDTLCIACARIGSGNSKIIAGEAKDLLKKELGKGMQCLIVPGKLHFVEEEMVEKWK